MQRAKRLVMVVLVAAGLSLGGMACKSKQKADHPEADHPKGGADHPKSGQSR